MFYNLMSYFVFSCSARLCVGYESEDVLFLHLKAADHGQMVAEATLVECAEVGAVGLHVAVGGVFFHEEG